MRTLAQVAILLALIGCEGGDAIAPPELRLGRDECAECGMSVVEAKHAAAAVVGEEGSRQAVLFDDWGCLLDWMESNPDRAIEASWGRSEDGENWIESETTWFVVGSSVRTPMDSGILCLPSEEAALGAAAESGGTVCRAPELKRTRQEARGTRTHP